MGSPFKQSKKMSAPHFVHFYFTVNSVKRQVAKEAAESGLGVRCLESKILAMLEDEVFVAPDMEEYEISG